ncbi:hypothetical protein SUGI_0858470 [Cryptomeria japonica]|nr:hypothetical protein SUGI_0858470 [Cryptomeria japonica]
MDQAIVRCDELSLQIGLGSKRQKRAHKNRLQIRAPPPLEVNRAIFSDRSPVIPLLSPLFVNPLQSEFKAGEDSKESVGGERKGKEGKDNNVHNGCG